MTPQDFAYWLQGFFELSDTENLSPSQISAIREHLALVFDKKTPDNAKMKEYVEEIENLKQELMLERLKHIPPSIPSPSIPPMPVPNPGIPEWPEYHPIITC